MESPSKAENFVHNKCHLYICISGHEYRMTQTFFRRTYLIQLINMEEFLSHHPEKRIFVSSAMKYIERHSCDGCGGANLFLSGFM